MVLRISVPLYTSASQTESRDYITAGSHEIFIVFKTFSLIVLKKKKNHNYFLLEIKWGRTYR